MMHRLDIDPDLLGRVNHALDEIRAGKMVILVDDEDRENEGDLTMAADKVTPEAINFMAVHGRGLICLALSEEVVDRLELPMMQAPGRSGPPLGTAFTVSVEARTGVTTGISAADRAHTIRTAVHPNAKPEDLVTPGHIFPLRARRGGVLVRTGQTEGSVDLARLAGCSQAGVICEIMNDDGTMARKPDLERFAERHGLLIVKVADLIQYRMQTERLVRRVSEQSLTLDVTGTEWKAIVYEVTTEARQFLALVKGELSGVDPVLARVHGGSVLSDIFSSTESEGGKNLREALVAIERAGRGVCVYLPTVRDLGAELRAHAASHDRKGPAPSGAPLREFGLGAQVLADLGLHQIRLLTNNPRKIANLAGFGLQVVDRVPLLSMQS
ncbi:MAG TPA: 3,4-dihydroxy-2-butanone-4-phosphate synthase [Polyangiaceae bacterium]|nr:3,4-dihydroxy-2-butanone-4-phosphate synthase [Polyangiaceae bacterium]